MTEAHSDWSDKLEKALIYQKKGEVTKARKIINELLPALEQAMRDNPTQAELHNNLGNTYKLLGNTHRALQHYQEALRLKSPYPEAHNNLGTLLYKMGLFEKAIAHFQKALRMDPYAGNTHYNLALVLIQQNRLLEAATHFQKTLEYYPHHHGATHNLGIAYTLLKNYSAAEPLLIDATQEEPNNIQALYHLGIVQTSLGKFNDAKKTYETILKIDDRQMNTHHNLATLYLHFNDGEKALEHYKEAYQLDPKNVTAEHMIAALSGKTLPEGAPTEYVRALFNQYAYNYDEHVKSTLQYQVPSLLRSAIAPYALTATHPWKVLDLGCGTGLCAPQFSDLAGNLTGIDISENMIQIAKQRGGYDKLIVDDAIHYLLTQHQSFDLIVAADVLVYMGDLTQLFKLVKEALCSHGLFCFSTEWFNKDPKKPYALQKTGRYAHQPKYIQTLCDKLGFSILIKQAATLRLQDNLPITGYLWVIK